MDEALKARLIGAAVLVAVAVLLIPELLSGRRPVESVTGEGGAESGTRTIVINLGGGGTRPAEPVESRSPSPAVPLAGSEPGSAPEVAPSYETVAPARESERASPPDEQPPPVSGVAAPATPTPAPATASQAQPTPAAAPRTTGGWAVQVGAFGSAATANDLVKKLAADGYHAFVAPVQRGGKTLHRVRVGPAPDKPGAERMASQLKGKGLPATVVQND